MLAADRGTWVLERGDEVVREHGDHAQTRRLDTLCFARRGFQSDFISKIKRTCHDSRYYYKIVILGLIPKPYTCTDPLLTARAIPVRNVWHPPHPASF